MASQKYKYVGSTRTDHYITDGSGGGGGDNDWIGGLCGCIMLLIIVAVLAKACL